jgi:hypothetical protein
MVQGFSAGVQCRVFLTYFLCVSFVRAPSLLFKPSPSSSKLAAKNLEASRMSSMTEVMLDFNCDHNILFPLKGRRSWTLGGRRR